MLSPNPSRPSPKGRSWRSRNPAKWRLEIVSLLSLCGFLYLSVSHPTPMTDKISHALCHPFGSSETGIVVLDPVPVMTGDKPQRLPWVATSTKVCERTLVIRLDSEYGFGSMLMLLALPGLAMADLYGYTPILDDTDFNYGRLTDYFKPLPIPCTPPPDWASLPRIEYAQPGWEGSDHIYLARHPQYTEVKVDLFWRNEWMRNGQREGVVKVDNEVFGKEGLGYLPSDMTFTPALRPAYRAISSSLSQLWQLNDLMLKEVEALVSTTRGARRSGRPVLSVIIRLGDKGRELSWNPGPNSYGNYQGFLSMAKEQLSLIEEPGSQPPGLKPILLVMSDDVATAVAGLKSLPDSSLFELVPLTGEVTETALPKSDDRYTPLLPPPASDAPKGGHEQTHFNSLPVTARIASARTFIRDLHYISRHTDSISVSSGSNAGRVALILVGEGKAYGYTPVHEEKGRGRETYRSIGGLARSLDTRWFPCVFYKGCFL